jgi:hypothetical protein
MDTLVAWSSPVPAADDIGPEMDDVTTARSRRTAWCRAGSARGWISQQAIKTAMAAHLERP